MRSEKQGRFYSPGVDLVEFKKARRFYDSHKDNLDSFFSKPEIAFIRKAGRPHENLAVLLAAKEAVFKSLDLSWMGPRGFRNILISARGAKLRFRLAGSLSRLKARGLELSCRTTQKYALAYCAAQS